MRRRTRTLPGAVRPRPDGRDGRSSAPGRVRTWLSPRRIVVTFLLLVAGVSVGSATALAYFGGAGSGSGASGVASVSAPTAPTAAPAGGGAVTVSWAAVTLSNGHAVDGYVVKRYTTGGVLQTILSACTGTVAATSCVESAVPTGVWKYTVTPVIGLSWVGSESAMSGS